MSFALWGRTDPEVSALEPGSDADNRLEVVRDTAPDVNPGTPAAEQETDPEFNQVTTDDNPDLGMTTRTEVGNWTPREKYAPEWVTSYGTANAGIDENNAKIAETGYFVTAELAGDQGHGSMAYGNSIEPIVRDGAAFGEDYFKAEEPGAYNTDGDDTGIQADFSESRDDAYGAYAYGVADSHADIGDMEALR